MKLPRIVPIIGMSLALVVAAPLAHAEPTTDPSEPVPTTSEPVPAPEPTSEPTTEPPPPPPTPTPTPTPTPLPTSTYIPPPTTTSPSTPTAPRTPVPSTTYTPPPPSSWSGTAYDEVPEYEPEPLAPVDISAQLAQADALLASLSEGNAAMSALLAQMKTLTDEANAALEAKSIADDVARQSTAAAASSRATALRLAADLERKHQQLRDWAFSAYSDGGSTAELISVFDALLKDPSKAGNPVGDLAYLTDDRLRLFEDIKGLTERQSAAAERTQTESVKAREAAAEAAKARLAADEALRKQTEIVAATKESQAEALRNAAPLAAMLLGLASPEAKARGEAILAALLANNMDVPDLERPCSDDDASRYPNGQLPSSALCPLWMAPGEFATPSAAVAFNAMSKKFATDFGRPICVADSYRSFTDQVLVKATRGWWAAPPGTSNHGLGKALDLCGGINNFGTIEHLWMKQNAPLFGWFHPSWAAADGRKPEPWHWEFAG